MLSKEEKKKVVEYMRSKYLAEKVKVSKNDSVFYDVPFVFNPRLPNYRLEKPTRFHHESARTVLRKLAADQ